MRKKLSLLIMLLALGLAPLQAQRYSIYGVGFYNLENLFDTKHDEGKNDLMSVVPSLASVRWRTGIVCRIFVNSRS